MINEREENPKRVSIHVDGILTPEAAAIADPLFAAAEKAAQPMYERLDDQRRLTGEDMAFYVGPRRDSLSD